ncbi:MAG: DUF2752 domain-containing protein [Defluviitaleaceae bacterium]|nr:DUF2752 domain-containing protein [Defluviitaleaceae bacterium]
MVSSTSSRVLIAFGIGVAVIIVFATTPISIPCIFKLIFGIPCPACGLTRAFIYLLQFNLSAALRMNILLIPLLIGGTAFFVCAFVEQVTKRPALNRFNAFLAKKWIIAIAIALMLASWYYNITVACITC